jgi:hypothetical protein
MTAAVHIPAADAIRAALEGERRAEQLLRACRDGFRFGPDALLHAIQDLCAERGVAVDAGPELRAFMRTIQKRLERCR